MKKHRSDLHLHTSYFQTVHLSNQILDFTCSFPCRNQRGAETAKFDLYGDCKTCWGELASALSRGKRTIRVTGFGSERKVSRRNGQVQKDRRLQRVYSISGGLQGKERDQSRYQTIDLIQIFHFYRISLANGGQKENDPG